MAITHTSTASTVIPELWASETRDTREDKLVILNTFDRTFEAELLGKGFGDTVHISGFDNLGTQNTASMTSSTRSLTYTAGVYLSQVNLVVDTHGYMAVDLGSEVDIFSNVDNMAKLAHKAGYSVALALDDAAAAFIDDFSTALGTLAVSLTDADVRGGKRRLDNNKAPEEGRTFLFSATQLAEFLGVEKYVNALYNKAIGSLDGAAMPGALPGRLYGFNWLVSTNVEGSDAAGHDNGMYQKESVAVAVLQSNRTETFYDIDSDSDKVAVHSLYGMIEVRDDHGIFMRGL